MAAVGYLESILNVLPRELRVVLVNYTREAFKTLAFGAPDVQAVAATNFGGHLVPFTTNSTPDGEVAIAHGLGRVPRLVLTGVLAPNTVNATAPELTITRAADAAFLYLSSPIASASGHVYVE